jgi:hypothetical protein
VTVLFHPEFAQDILRFEAQYRKISTGLAGRFRREIDLAIEAITRSPGGAGHFLQCGSKLIAQLRRRNLPSLPFFILYGCTDVRLVFGSVIANRSDPLTWLSRFSDPDAG